MTGSKREGFGYRISLAEMQRTYIRYLEVSLIEIGVSLDTDKNEWKVGGKAEHLGPTLRSYVQAIQDHEYMVKFSMDSVDPFQITSEQAVDRGLLDKVMLRRHLSEKSFVTNNTTGAARTNLEEQEHEMRILRENSYPTPPWEEDGRAKSAAEKLSVRPANLRKALMTRIAGALISGTFLIVPMWILVLERDIYLHLGVATACVSAFGALMAWFLNTVEAVFAATLAYAAVLMVFIGVMMEDVRGE